MNLVFFSIRTKGIHNFTRRLATVFTRFGFNEARTSRALHSIINTLQAYNAAPTFFIPAVVLGRHPTLLAKIAGDGAEIGVHGYVHNDYRALSYSKQYEQTSKAVDVFQETQTHFQGFRNPYLGWTEESLQVFSKLGFVYDSNDAIHHDVINFDGFPLILQNGYEKSLSLFQAIMKSSYTVRPYFAGNLLRIPTSIPDDEMLFDRLRITDAKEVGRIWSRVMQNVYELGGIYTLNLHPERGVLCKQALESLLSYARNQPLPVWITRLSDVAEWWKERSQFQLRIMPLAPGRWEVEATCTPRATLVARHLHLEDQVVSPWYEDDVQAHSHRFIAQSAQCPCLGISPQTPQEVDDFLLEQGYPFVRCSPQDADLYTYYLDIPEGLGVTREEQVQRKSKLVEQIETLAGPLIYFGCWPNGSRAALSVTGDIDSVTIQDFFLRILEVQQYK